MHRLPILPDTTGSRSRRHVIVLLLIAATVMVYAQAVRFEFVVFDDLEYLTQNEHVRAGLTLNGVVWAFTTRYMSNWHPLAWLSHMLDCELFGLNPAGHHAVSVLLHILNTVLLFVLLTRMTGRTGRSGFVAALFALHPLHVESVAWISERKDVLSAVFGFGAIQINYAQSHFQYAGSWWIPLALLFSVRFEPLPLAGLRWHTLPVGCW